MFPPAGAASRFCTDEEMQNFYTATLDAFPEPRLLRGVERAAAKQFPNVKPSKAAFFCETFFTKERASLLYALGFAVRETLEALIRASQEYEAGENSPVFATSPYSRAFRILENGRLHERDDDLFHGKFLKGALAEVNINRFMRCEICRAFMYSVRQGQKACSQRCNAVRRVRAWRAKKDKYKFNRYIADQKKERRK
jgi:hypothetical protein